MANYVKTSHGEVVMLVWAQWRKKGKGMTPIRKEVTFESLDVNDYSAFVCF